MSRHWTNLSVKLPIHLDAAVRRYATETGRPLSDVIRHAITTELGEDRIDTERRASLHPDDAAFAALLHADGR